MARGHNLAATGFLKVESIRLSTSRQYAGSQTVPELAEPLDDYPSIDRTSTNACDDAEVLVAVRATGPAQADPVCTLDRDCMAFPALDALRHG
jgi:hypothetical protein